MKLLTSPDPTGDDPVARKALRAAIDAAVADARLAKQRVDKVVLSSAELRLLDYPYVYQIANYRGWLYLGAFGSIPVEVQG